MHRKRVLILSAVGLFLSGCFVSSYLKITDRRTWEPGEKLLAEKKYPELSASLKALNAELHPPVRRPEGALTDFGDLVMKLGRNGVLPEVKSARAALGDRTKRPEALAASARARAALGWLDGLPLEGLRDEALSPRAVATARDELEKAEAELSALAARQVALLNEDEAAGRTALALYGWLRLPVQSPDEAALRGRKIHALSRELALLTSGSYALVAGEGVPPAYREYLHEGQRRALRAVGNARFVVPGEADAVVTLSGAEPRVNRSSQEVKRTWEYPTGKREVENPRYRHAQERLRDFEKSAAGNKKTYDSTRCPSSGSQKSRIKAPAGTCADSYYSEWKRAERNAEAYRERLRSTSPRTWELVYSQHLYPAREDTAVAEVALTFDISFRNGQPAKRLEVDARITRTAYSRAAEPRVQMPAAAETLPPDEALLDELRGEAVRRVAEAVGAARDGLLVQFEQALAAAEGDALLRAETTVRLDAARGKGGLAGVAEVVERRLGGGLGPAPLVPALLRPGTAALRFERTVDFAQVELDAGRPGSAYAAWALMGELADGALEARRLAARDVSAKHLDEQRLLSLSVEGAGASGAAVLAGLKAASARYAGFPADAAQLSPGTPLRLTVTAAAPRISRTAGEVTLEQEVKEEPEENEAPAPPQKVPYAATRSAATLQGTVSVRAELGGRSVAFELPVTHVAEVFVHPARPETRLRARNEALPGDDVLVQAWARGAGLAALARVLEEGHAPVAPGPGPALDAAILRALRSADPRRGVDVQGLLPALEQAVGAVDAELLGEALARFRR